MALALIVTVSAASAGPHNEKKWYAGAALGAANIDAGVSSQTGSVVIDESDTGGKIFAGYRINNYFGVELSYSDFGQASIRGNTGDTFTHNGVTYTFNSSAKVEADAQAVGLQGIFYVPMEDIAEVDWFKYLTPFFKAGVNFWEMEYSNKGVLNTNLPDDDGTAITYGLGLNINITPHFVVRGEYERFRAEDDVDLISGAIIIRF